jgi:hypothetical protein
MPLSASRRSWPAGVAGDHEVAPGQRRLDVDPSRGAGIARRLHRLARRQQRLRRNARPIPDRPFLVAAVAERLLVLTVREPGALQRSGQIAHGAECQLHGEVSS